MTTTIGVFLYDNVEVLDFAGPFEVFGTASRLHARRIAGDQPLFNVLPIAELRGNIQASGRLTLHVLYNIDDHPPLEVLIIPGGIHTPQLARRIVIRWIAATAAKTTLVASVCTGAFLLAQAGLLNGKSATTHWEDIPAMRERFPEVNVLEGQRWVDCGNVVTSAGISAGIDMCLHLVERLEGRELALLTARQMEWQWDQSGTTIA